MIDPDGGSPYYQNNETGEIEYFDVGVDPGEGWTLHSYSAWDLWSGAKYGAKYAWEHGAIGYEGSVFASASFGSTRYGLEGEFFGGRFMKFSGPYAFYWYTYTGKEIGGSGGLFPDAELGGELTGFLHYIQVVKTRILLSDLQTVHMGIFKDTENMVRLVLWGNIVLVVIGKH